MNENDPHPVPLTSAEAECKRLREENARLRELLLKHHITIPSPLPESPAPAGNRESLNDSAAVAERGQNRITLFRSLFRGAKTFTLAGGKARMGDRDYVPAAARDWRAINKSRPEDRKKIDQQTRKLFPLTDKVVEDHLLGNHTIGVYPLLTDETCWFLAIDFDKNERKERKGTEPFF